MEKMAEAESPFTTLEFKIEDFSTGSKEVRIRHGEGVKQATERNPNGTSHLLSVEKTVEAENSVIDTTMEFRIEDFSTATEELRMYHEERHRHTVLSFSASVYPNGDTKDNDGWLVVLPNVYVSLPARILRTFVSLCIVSIIDIEGNSRFPRYFEKSGYTGAKYLKKSFFLKRADEFLPEGVLLLRCDICFDLNVIKKGVVFDCDWDVTDYFAIFLWSILHAVCFKNGTETGDPRCPFIVYDLTSQILTLPQFHESRKRFGVHSIPPELPWTNSESKEDSKDILADVWIFDTSPDRFLLSLAQRPGNVGSLLVNASPVIRRCINAPMKEQREKRIELSNVDSRIFPMVLYILESGRFPHYGLAEIAEVYKFSHLYEMENLQKKCAEHMVQISKVDSELEKIVKIADLYSDKYLLKLLESRRRELENLNRTGIDNRINSDCFI